MNSLVVGCQGQGDIVEEGTVIILFSPTSWSQPDQLMLFFRVLQSREVRPVGVEKEKLTVMRGVAEVAEEALAMILGALAPQRALKTH